MLLSLRLLLPGLLLKQKLLLGQSLSHALLLTLPALLLHAPALYLPHLFNLSLMLLLLALLTLLGRHLREHANRHQRGDSKYAKRRNHQAITTNHKPPMPTASLAKTASSGMGYNPRMAVRVAILVLLLTAGLHAADVWTWWVDDCTGVAANSGCNKDDAELARWAFAGWQRESGDRIVFTKSASRQHARLTIHWANGASLYGETQPVMVDGKRGAEIYILPQTNATRVADPLLRDTIVFLTFVHETGHALGLRHTANFEDIMYSFQYGGDIDAYFDRYRRLLTKRSDIALHSGLSDGDRAALRAVLAQ